MKGSLERPESNLLVPPVWEKSKNMEKTGSLETENKTINQFTRKALSKQEGLSEGSSNKGYEFDAAEEGPTSRENQTDAGAKYDGPNFTSKKKATGMK